MFTGPRPTGRSRQQGPAREISRKLTLSTLLVATLTCIGAGECGTTPAGRDASTRSDLGMGADAYEDMFDAAASAADVGLDAAWEHDTSRAADASFGEQDAAASTDGASRATPDAGGSGPDLGAPQDPGLDSGASDPDAAPADPCVGRCIYVSAGTGADDNPGTRAAPLRTINKAAALVGPGATVVVAPGIYPERVRASKSGSAAARIRFVSGSKWAAKIAPTDRGGSGWAGAYGFKVDGSYVDVEGFEVTPGAGGQMNVGIYVNGVHHVHVLNNKVHRISVPGMPEGPGGIAMEMGSDANDVIGNWVYDIGVTQLTHGIYFADGSGSALNNVIGKVSGFGIHLWHTPHDVRIINNTIVNTGMKGHYSSGGIVVGAGEHAGANARNCLVANNIVYGSPSIGIQESGTVSNNRYVNNLTFNNARDWALKNGVQTGSSAADPRFVGYKPDGTGDYRLQAGSPAIDKASAEHAPPTDFEGRRRAGSPDLGAMERVNP